MSERDQQYFENRRRKRNEQWAKDHRLGRTDQPKPRISWWLLLLGVFVLVAIVLALLFKVFGLTP